MTYRQELREEALALFCQNMSLDAISAHFGGRPSKECIREWRDKYDWDEHREELRKRSTQKLIENLAEVNAHQWDTLEEVIRELLAKLKATGTETAESAAKAIVECIRTQRLLVGEPTEHWELSGAALDSVIERELARLVSSAKEGVSPAPEADPGG